MDKIRSSVAAKVTALVLALLLIVSIVPVNGLTNSLRNSASAAETPLVNQATPDEVTGSEPDNKNVQTERKISDLVTVKVESSGVAKPDNYDLYSKPEKFSFTYKGKLDECLVYLDEDKDVFESKFKYTLKPGNEESVLDVDLKGIADGKHKLSVRSSETVELFYYEFIADSTAPKVEFKYDKEYSNDSIEVSVYPKDKADAVNYAGVDFSSMEVSNGSGEEVVLSEIKKDKNKAKYRTFKASEPGVYTVSVADFVKNTVVVNTQEIIIDVDAPKIEINSDLSGCTGDKWTKDDVTVNFTVTDNGGSGVDKNSISVTNNDNSKDYEVSEVSGGYSFTADAYGEYTISASDKAGNPGKALKQIINIDKAAPHVKITFSKAENAVLNFLTFGLYSNNEITVKVESDVKIGEAAPIESIMLKEGDKELTTDSSSLTVTKKDGVEIYSKEYKLSADSNQGKKYILNCYAKDSVGNEIREDIKKGTSFDVYIDSSEESLGDEFEVIVSAAKPNAEFTDTWSEDEYYSEECSEGNLEYKAAIKDEFIGINSAKLYFVKQKALDYINNGKIENSEKFLESVIYEENPFKANNTEKITTQDLKYTIPSDTKTGLYAIVIEATNNSGNTCIVTKNVKIDKDAPTVSKVEVLKTTNAITNFADGKLYANDALKIKVTAADKYSGLKDIELYCNGTKLSADSEEISEDGSKTFSLEASEEEYTNLSIKTYDKCNNSKEQSFSDFGNITLDKKEQKIDENFGIYINESVNKIEVVGNQYIFNGYDDLGDDTYKGDNPNGYIKFTLASKIGITDISIALNDETIADEQIEISGESNTEKTVIVKTGNLSSGKYALTTKVNNNYLKQSTFIRNFLIDNSAPEIVDFEFEKYNDLQSQILSLLSFGVYSNESVKVTVTARDKEPSTGIESITLDSESSLEISQDGVISEISGEKGYRTYRKTFVLSVDAEDFTTEKSFYNNLTATVTDKADFTGKMNYNETENKEIVITKNAPTIDADESQIVHSLDNSIGGYYDGENYCFEGNVKFSFKVYDNYSKLSSVQVMLNGSDITEYCNDKESATPGSYTVINTADETGAKVEETEITVDTANIPDGILSEGVNDFTINATGNNGVVSTKNVKFIEKNTSPEIKGFEFTKSATAVDQILSFLTFGIYSNNDVDVKVTATDNAPSSGIDSIKLSSTGKLEIIDEGRIEYTNTSPEDCTYSKTFTLKVDKAEFSTEKSFYNDLTATVTDKVGNSGSGNYNKDGKPEVVITQKAPEISTNFDNLLDSDSARESKYYDEAHDNYWFAGDVKFSFDVKDDYSKLSSVKLMLNGTDITKYCSDTESSTPGKYTDTDTVDETGIEVSATTISIDTANIPGGILAEGKNIFTITSTGNNGVTCDASEVEFYVDTEGVKDENISYEFSKTQSPADQILSFLTFGIYSNNDVDVKVTAVDNAPSSGIDSIELSKTNGLEIVDEGRIEYTNTSPEDCTYSKTFTLKVDEAEFSKGESFYENITATVTDKVGNAGSGNYNKEGKPEVVITQKAPEISTNFDNLLDSDSARESKYYDEAHDNYWFAGDVKFSFDVKDDYSKLSSVQLMLNGTDITEYCSDTASSTPGKYTDTDTVDENGIEVSVTTITINTADIPNFDLNKGKNKFEIVATGNNGVTCDASEVEFYVDTEGVKAENISFEFSKTQSPADQILSFLTFGIYSNNDVDVKVTATDNAPSSGIDSIELSKTNGLEIVDEGRIEYTNTSPEDCTYVKTFTLKVDEAEFSKGESFYENITATVTDKVGNVGNNNYNERNNQEIVITQKAPEISTNFDNLLDSDSARESKYYDEAHDNYWFAGDVKFSFDVKDDYSKLSSVQLMLNGTDITEYCSDTESATPGKYTDTDTVDVNGKEVSATTISVDTANIPDEILAEGKNIFTITSTGNNGVTCDASEVEFYVDTEGVKAENISFEFSKTQSPADQILSFLTFGIYSNNDVDVKVTATDNAPSSGIDSIELSKTNGLEIVDEGRIEYTNTSPEDCTYVKTFTLKVDEAEFSKGESFYENITATVTDKVGNVGNNNYNERNNQEIVITQKAPEISTNFDNLLDSDSARESKYYDEAHDNYWFAGDVKFSFDVKDDYSKLSSVQLMLNGTDITEYCSDTESATPGKYTDTDTVDVNGKEVSATTISVDTANIPDEILAEGKNIFTITSTGNNGVTCDASEVEFYVDTEEVKAENISYEFSKTQSPLDQILSFLTFGIYSNNDVDVKVTATDNAPSSGIEKIELSSTSGLKIEDKGESSVVYKNESPKACTYSRTFTLKVDKSDFSKSESFYDNLTATVTDKVGNAGSSNYNETNNQEIVITKNVPEITTSFDNLNDAGNTATKYYDGKDYWFAGDVRFSFDVKDDYSKLSSVKLMLNGTDITKYCSDTESSTPGKYTDIDTTDTTGKKVSHTTITINTADIPNFDLNEGRNKFEIVATANNGENSKTETVEFCIDTTKPQIDDFKFEPAGNMDENTTPVETTDYGYYFRNDVNVTVIASDGKGSGIGGSNNQVNSKIYYRCVDVDGSVTDGAVLPGESFTVRKDFKGQIYAYAIDNVGNTCSEQHPYGSIVESEQKHRESSNIALETVGNVVNKDDANRDLYNNDVKITIALKDSYSGIRTVHYRIYDDYGDNIENTFSIDQSGNFSDTYGWSYSKDKNLVTDLKTTIPVAFNSNNIRGYVEFTDRAGHKETEDIIPFSIDKTVPTIKVVYDNNDFKTYRGDKYFKADRTATITVTERNFSENDFTKEINTSSNRDVAIDGWTHNYNSADPDASTHVAHIRFTSDDDYTVDMAFKDMAQNRAESPAQEKFTLDKTLPKISVSFDNNSSLNGSYYKAERTATITIEEHNFAADTEHLDIKFDPYAEDNITPVSAPTVSSWTSNGDTHTATVPFTDDGKFEFTVDYKDLAYNDAEQAKVDTFYVDKTDPEIKFENVEANAAYADSISPVVVFSDNNYDGYTTLSLERVDINSKSKIANMNKTSVLNGVTGETVTYDNFGTVEENDGIYKLSAKMVDKAGNEKSKEIIFSVNRFGSTYMAGDESTESLLSSGYSNAESDVLVKEINVNKVSKQSVSLSCNNSNVSKLTANENYTVSSSGGSGSWFEYTYKINKDNFVEEGYYTITLSSTDSVKHTVSNITALTKERKCPVSFTIDKTVPEVRISGVEDGELCEEASRQVKVVCEDVNISADTLVIELNGKELEEGEDKDFVLSEDNAGEITAKFKVEAIGNDTKQNIKVSIVDKAGNEGEGSVSEFILSASLLARFFANTPLVIATFAAIAVIIGLVLFFVIRRRKKNEEK